MTSVGLTGSRSWGERLLAGSARGSGLIVAALVILIAVFLLSQALPALADNEAGFLTSRQWQVTGDNPRFGVAALMWTTVVTSVIAVVVAVPVGVGAALFLTHYAPPWLAAPAARLVDLLAVVPSIVYGIWGLYHFGPAVLPVQEFLARTLGSIPLFSPNGTKYTDTGIVFVVALVLAIMILPIVTAMSRDAFARTPRAHQEAALALGATRSEMIRTAVLPYGRGGVLSAALLGLGRALGETLAVTIILSTVAEGSPWSWSVFAGGETFASKIANNAGDFDTPQKAGAFVAAGLVLFLLTFAVAALARLVADRSESLRQEPLG